ncbi:lytic murein transglycosylase [Micromonospora sp. WMMD729]|uniref:lytic transglycosylase domain-containing protein n=1 Tax=Micromonospora sp. WMMD729 TaxID=3404127 RepID=UPI003BF5334F
MSDTRRVVDGEDKTRVQPLRPAAPLDGPLAESGAAPDPVPPAVPRPRRPWLSSGSTDAKTTPPASGEAAPSSTVDAPAAVQREDAPDDIAAKDAPTTDATGTATAAADRAEGGIDSPARDNPDGDVTARADTTAAEPAKADPAKTDAATASTTAADTAKNDATALDAAKAGTTAADAAKTGTTDADTATSDATAADPAKAKTGDAKAGTAKTGNGTVAAGTAATDLTATKVDGVAVVPATTPGRRRRVPFAHAVRLPPPRQAAVTAARATRDWSRRPSGRLTVPGVFLLALVAATAAAGALLVPATIRGSKPVAVDASAAPTVAVPPALPLDPRPTGPLPSGAVPTGPPPTGAFPTGVVPTGPAVAPTVGGRPSDALAGWAQQVGAKVGIPPAAMQAYGYAELMLAQTNRSCALSWTTLAAIGQVESGHGSANGAQLGPNGKVLPKIIGLPLDGKGGRMRIIDTDRGALDNDSTYDRAIGPMQFIPTTWQEIGADADQDGIKDPHDLDDAALAAGNYLCKGGRNLSIPGDWWNAILSYNDVRRYAQDVYNTADRYGRASRQM